MKVFIYIKENSNRIPRKNFRMLGDKPLWRHLIDELSTFPIFIDTDSKEILNECADLEYVTAYYRDQKLIDMENDPDNKASPALLMVDNFLDKYVDDDNEPIVVTHVTSPFLTKETVEMAVEMLKDFDFVHSVHSVQDFAWMGEEFKPINFDPSYVQKTQDVPEIHFSNGAFFIFTKKTFKKYNNRIGPGTYYYQLGHVESVEIDTLKDFDFAELVLRGLK